MKRKILAVLLSLCMVLSLMPVSVLAADDTAAPAEAADDENENNAAEIDGETYATLADAITAAQDGDTIVLLRSTNETGLPVVAGDITLDLAGCTVTTDRMSFSGDAVIMDSTASGAPRVSEDYQTVTYKSGKLIASGNVRAINGGTLTLESGTIEATIFSVGDVTGAKEVNSTVIVNGGYIHATEFSVSPQGKGAAAYINGGVMVSEDNAVIAGNGSNGSGNRLGGTTIEISDGVMIGHIKTPGYIACGVYHPQQGTLSISGGTIVADGGVGVEMRGGTLDMTGGTIQTNGQASGWIGDSKIVAANCYGVHVDGDSRYYDYANCTVSISGDVKIKTDADVANVIVTPEGDEEKLSISGGLYTTDVSKYCASGLMALENDDPVYTYKIGPVPEETTNDVDTAVKQGSTVSAVDTGKITDEADQTAASAAAASTKTTEALPVSDPVTGEDKAKAVTDLVNADKLTLNEENKIPDEITVTVIQQPYLDVTVTNIDTSEETPVVEMDISPKYDLIATTNANAPTTEDSVTLEHGKALTVTADTTVSVTLPAAFKGQTVHIKHTASSGVYYYTAIADADGTVTFTTRHGFSPFVFSLSDDAAAVVGDTGYDSLQVAADAAQSGAEITLKKGASHELSFTATKSVTVVNGTGAEVTVRFNGKDKTIAADARETFSYTKSSSGSSGSSVSAVTEKPTFRDVPENAYYAKAVAWAVDKGIAAGTSKNLFSPDASCTRGQIVTFLWKLAGSPASKATASFTDVAEDAYYAKAVSWAAEQGIVKGMTETTFAPELVCTREQMVTFVYRFAKAEGWDTTQSGMAAREFADFDQVSDYAGEAVTWAVNAGLLHGSNNLLMPQSICSRAQIVTFLYRADQNK